WNVIGQLRLTIEGEWESEREVAFGDGVAMRERSEGWDTVKFKAHHPIFQYVSSDGWLDYTVVGKLSIGVPLAGDVHHDTYEIYPLLGQMLKLGDHFSVQTWTGVNFLAGGEEAGEHQFLYGVLFGYRLSHEEL